MVKHKWAIHTILVKSTLPYNEAEKHAFNILHKKVKGYVEGEHYRFTNIDKKHFNKFRTKIINPDIDIIFGKYKPEHIHLEGGSIASFLKKGVAKIAEKGKEIVGKVVDKAKDVFKAREGYNNKCLKNIKLYGDKKIKKIVVVRTPLSTIATLLGKVVSLGQMEEIMKKEGIDRFFHIGIVATLDDGMMLLIEKNSVINIEPISKLASNSEIMDVDLKGKSLTMNDLLDKGYEMAINKDEWWLYNAFSWNCQAFISLMLRANGIMTEELKGFLYQELSKVLKQLYPTSQKIIKGTTDLSAIVDKLSGKGKVAHAKEYEKMDLIELKRFIKKRGNPSGTPFIAGYTKMDKEQLIKKLTTKKRLMKGGHITEMPPEQIGGGGLDVKMPVRKLIEEHKRLLKVLKSGKVDKREIKDQHKELDKYMRMVGKGMESDSDSE